MSEGQLRVVKVGGSLLDLPDLPERLRGWLADQPPMRNVLLVGGGPLCDQVRTWHAQQPLDDAAAHWMCIDLMSVTARLLHERMPELDFTDDWETLSRKRQASGVLFDAATWLHEIEPTQPGRKLPIGWDVTSDAIAGRLAVVLRADELTLLKSTDPPRDVHGLAALAECGLIDAALPQLAGELPTLCVEKIRR